MNSGSLLSAEMVRAIHDLILTTEPGCPGELESARLDGALARIGLTVDYCDIDDLYQIAALYAMAIATGHAFIDCNKRTGLVTALTYLSLQGVDLPRSAILEQVMVDLANGEIDYNDLAEIFHALAVSQAEPGDDTIL